MLNNVKLITAPDIIFDQAAILLAVCPGTALKDEIENYLLSVEEPVNVYLFNNETDIKWLLTVAKMSDHVLVDIDNCKQNVSHFLGYIMSMSNTYYKCEHMQVQWDLINQNRFYDFPNISKDTNERFK